MSALDIVERISELNIIRESLKYCLVDNDKKPFRIDNTLARPNHIEDFVDFENLLEADLDKYAGLGISIQGSKICAIDVDHCFSKKNDISSADERAINILNLFSDKAYCEFSFSGTGLRVLFKAKIIDDYSNMYYIKNEKQHIEFYQPNSSFRYVTITGNCISNNSLSYLDDSGETLYNFLNKYMKRERMIKEVYTNSFETLSYEELMKKVKYHYMTNVEFQDLWFTNAPGSGKDESERDYHLIAYLYERITQDKNLIKQIFESSIFFKTKDYKHMNKWTYNNNRYFNYLYDRISRRNK